MGGGGFQAASNSFLYIFWRGGGGQPGSPSGYTLVSRDNPVLVVLVRPE